MNKIKCFFIAMLLIVGCSEDSDSVKISKCLDNESSIITVKSTVDKDVEADDVEVNDADSINGNENSLDVAKLISLENDMMIIDLTSDFNCSDAITYSVESLIDGDTVMIEIVSNHDGPVTACMCRKTITIEVSGNKEILEKINKVKFKLPDTDEYRDAFFEKSTERVLSEEKAVEELSKSVTIEEANKGRVVYSLDENNELVLSIIGRNEEQKKVVSVSLEAKDE